MAEISCQQPLEDWDALLAQGTFGEMLAEYATALQIYAQLAVKDLRPRSQRNLAIAHQRLGAARLAMKDLPGARAEFRACLSIPVDETARDAQITARFWFTRTAGINSRNPGWRRLCRRTTVTNCRRYSFGIRRRASRKDDRSLMEVSSGHPACPPPPRSVGPESL